MSSAKEELPLWGEKDTYKTWYERIEEYAGGKRLGHVLDQSNEPGPEPEEYVVARTAKNFIARVKPQDNALEMCEAAGLTLTAAQLRNLKEDDIDDDVLEQYAKAVRRQDKKIDKWEAKAESWPRDLEAMLSAIKRSVRVCDKVKRQVDGVDKTRVGDLREDLLRDVVGYLRRLHVVRSSLAGSVDHVDVVRWHGGESWCSNPDLTTSHNVEAALVITRTSLHRCRLRLSGVVHA